MNKYEALPHHREKPLLILGISGVIVLETKPSVPASLHRVSAWGKWVRKVVVPDDAAARISALSQQFEIVWASEWGHNAHTAFQSVLELPDEPWPFLPVQFNKLSMIRSYAGGWPWVWVDDAVVDLHGTPESAENGVIVRVDPAKGIDDLDADDLLRPRERATT